MVTTAGNGGLYSRLLMAIVPLLIVATLLTVLPPAGAAAGGYKYATVLFDGFTDIEGIEATIETADPTIRDDSNTHSLMQHWIGDANNYVEVGWRKAPSQPSSLLTWWGYHKNGVFQGYNYKMVPTIGVGYTYRVLWNPSAGCWNVTIHTTTYQGPCDIPGPTAMASTIQTGGEVYFENNPWNAMGVSGDLNVRYKRVGQAWTDLNRSQSGWRYVVDSNVPASSRCPNSGYYFVPLSQANSWQAYGCN